MYEICVWDSDLDPLLPKWKDKERGSPCLNPHSEVEKSEGSLFTNTDPVEEQMDSFITLYPNIREVKTLQSLDEERPI